MKSKLIIALVLVVLPLLTLGVTTYSDINLELYEMDGMDVLIADGRVIWLGELYLPFVIYGKLNKEPEVIVETFNKKLHRCVILTIDFSTKYYGWINTNTIPYEDIYAIIFDDNEVILKH